MRRLSLISVENRREQGGIKADLQGLKIQKPRELALSTQGARKTSQGSWRYGTRSMTGIWWGEDTPCSNSRNGEKVLLY